MSLYGLSEYGAEEALATTNVLPSGTSKFIALLTTLPTARDGTGLVEASGSGYTRIAHSAWSSASSGTDTTRSNSANITFSALTGDLPGIVGWAIYSALSGGNLIAYGPLVDSNGVEISRDFYNGDQVRFVTSELKIIVSAL